jgi:hypothetical protein
MGDQILRTTENNWQNFSQSLSNIFQTQYGDQSAIYAGLTKTLTDQMTNPHGFSPATLSALRGGTVDNLATQFNSARQGIGATQAARGDFGGEVKSGVNAQIQGQLSGQQASATAGGLDQIESEDAQLKVANQRKAEEGLQQVAQGESPTSYAGAATSAADETGRLGSAFFGTDQNSFGDKLGSSFASGLGATLSGGNSGKGSSGNQAAAFLGV